MKKLLCVVALSLSTVGLSAANKPILVVHAFTAAPGVELPYDLKSMQGLFVAEFKIMLGKQFDIVAEVPESSADPVYMLECEIAGWRPGNAAKRVIIGMGSGREASDLRYRVIDRSGKAVLEQRDTVRTNFYTQGAGSIGTLVHPIAQKIAERIKDAKLK